jgi:hypothetical protein
MPTRVAATDGQTGAAKRQCLAATPLGAVRPVEVKLTTTQLASVRTMVATPTHHNQDPAASFIAMGTSERESASGWNVRNTTALHNEQSMSNESRTQRPSFSIEGHVMTASFPESGIDNKVAARWQKGELNDDSPEIAGNIEHRTFSTDEAHTITSLVKKTGTEMPKLPAFYVARGHGMSVRHSAYQGLVKDEMQANRIECHAPVSWAVLSAHPAVRTNSNGSGLALLVQPNNPDAVPNQLLRVPDAKQSYRAKDSSLTEPESCMWNVYVLQFRPDANGVLTRTVFKLTAWSDVIRQFFNVTRGDIWAPFQSLLTGLDAFGAVFSSTADTKEPTSDVSSIFSALDGSGRSAAAQIPCSAYSTNLKMNGVQLHWTNILASTFRAPLDFVKSLMRFSPRPKDITRGFSAKSDADSVNAVLRKYIRTPGKGVKGNASCAVAVDDEGVCIFAMHTDIEFQAQLATMRSPETAEYFIFPTCEEFIVNDAACADAALKLGGERSLSGIVTIASRLVYNNIAAFPRGTDFPVAFEPLQECGTMVFIREHPPFVEATSAGAAPVAGTAAAGASG